MSCDFAGVDRKGNMKKLNSAKLAFIMFSAMTVACVSGSIGGTLAWYAYSTRANVSYSGTSVSETALLQIGICSDEALTGMPASISSVTYAGDSDHYYYFSEPGKGMTYDIIAKYLSKKGFATNELDPTTSGSYVTGNDQDDFGLKQAPNEIVHGNTIEAFKYEYVSIPFVFRVQGENSGSYIDNIELWLSNAVARASSTNPASEVYKAIRVFVDRDSRNYDSDFILNPSATQKGKTRVGGVLNRQRDDYFDYDGNGEILYGEYDNAALDLISASGYSGASVVDDVNGTGKTEPSTFVAKHNPGAKYYTNLSSQENDALFKHADYESISSIAPARDSYDRLTNVDPLNPSSVCKTRADDNHLARVNVVVYLEGWDFSVVDKERSHSFDLGLTFEMSRL